MKNTTIAQRAGTVPSHVSMILNGERRASPEMAARLEHASGKRRLFWLYPGEYDERGQPVPTEAKRCEKCRESIQGDK